MVKMHEGSLRTNDIRSTGEDAERGPEGEPVPSGKEEISPSQASGHEAPSRGSLPPMSRVRATLMKQAQGQGHAAALAIPRIGGGFGWLLKQVAQNPIGLAGCPPKVQEEAQRLARDAGLRALTRFERLSPEDRTEIIAAALDRFCRRGGAALASTTHNPAATAWENNPEPYFRHAVRCEAIALTERRYQDAPRGGGPSSASAEVDLDFNFVSWLEQARRRTCQLQGLERRVFFASAALDSVAAENESLKVALYTAIALRLRLNSVHKHMSRARQKLFCTKGREPIEWADAWKYLEPQSEELAHAARAYLAACRAHGTGDAVVRWADAHDQHTQCSNTFKEQSGRALSTWRAFVEALDAGDLRPRDVQADLLQRCVALGIDHRVIETRIKSGQTWTDLLLSVDVKRPTADERGAWRSLLAEHPFNAEVIERWQEMEERSDQADAAKSALNQAYASFLEAAAESPDDLIRKRNKFLNLVDAK